MGYEEIKALYKEKGYIFHEEPNNPNLFGRRNADLVTVDKFNDMIGFAMVTEDGRKVCHEWIGTTKPGLKNLDGVPFNPDGTAILIPGQYPNAWILGLHHRNDPLKRYPAYQQRTSGVWKVWRDKDADGQFDMSGKVFTNAEGINGHRASRNNKGEHVGLDGAGCQVILHEDEFLQWLWAGKNALDKGLPNSFHYTLFQD